jgi:hypothetical protein
MMVMMYIKNQQLNRTTWILIILLVQDLTHHIMYSTEIIMVLCRQVT